MNIRLFLTIIITLLSISLFAQEKEDKKEPELPEASVKKTSVSINGQQINYTVKTGYLSLKKETGEETAHIFYIAYTKNEKSNSTDRPITFSFNGGPGSSSVWLHLGMLGPRRVLMTDSGETLPPPYRLVDNDYSWLDLTDLVFIDPVSTGYSRTPPDIKEKQFHNYRKDIQSVGDFIRRYLTENDRWGSKKYVIGESYGTTRAAGLSEHILNEYGMYLNGIILVSSVINFQTLRTTPGNDLPYLLFLPTYTATAYYHKKLQPRLLEQPLKDILNEVEHFCTIDYNTALFQGNEINDALRMRTTLGLMKYTGLRKPFIEDEQLRISRHHFRKQLLKDSALVVGRFDSRYKMKDLFVNKERQEFDPSFQPAAHGAFSTCINDYLTKELDFHTHIPYEVLTGRVHPWSYNSHNRFLDVSEHVRRAMMKNPYMKVWIASGYYDMATPYFATEYTINHMPLPDNRKDNIIMTYYEAGHMMYLHKPSLIQLKQDAVDFFGAE